jgi:hypothetical protein
VLPGICIHAGKFQQGGIIIHTDGRNITGLTCVLHIRITDQQRDPDPSLITPSFSCPERDNSRWTTPGYACESPIIRSKYNDGILSLPILFQLFEKPAHIGIQRTDHGCIFRVALVDTGFRIMFFPGNHLSLTG